MKQKLTKLILAIGCVMFMSGQTYAQAYSEGKNNIHIGIGFPSLLGSSTSAFSGFGGFSSSSTPPMHVVFEHGFTEHISGGLYIGYTGDKVRYSDFLTPALTTGWDETYLIIGARGSYHFMTGDHFDPYVTLMLGYESASFKWYYSDPTYVPLVTTTVNPSGVGFSGSIGMNYLFSDNVGIFAELGYGIAIFNVGLSLKF